MINNDALDLYCLKIIGRNDLSIYLYYCSIYITTAHSKNSAAAFQSYTASKVENIYQTAYVTHYNDLSQQHSRLLFQRYSMSHEQLAQRRPI